MVTKHKIVETKKTDGYIKVEFINQSGIIVNLWFSVDECKKVIQELIEVVEQC